MEPPPIRYAHVGDGRVAYQAIGDGPVLVYCSGSWSHADLRWQHPLSAALMQRLAAFSRVIVFDRRGSGISDGLPSDEIPSWEHGVEDLLAVLDAENIQQAAVYGFADAGPVALLAAASHPDRISALILSSTTARFISAPDYPEGVPREQAESIVHMMSAAWGTEDLAAITAPSMSTDKDWARWNAMYQRGAASPGTASHHLASLFELDLRSVASVVSCPTLVLHFAANLLVPEGQPRWLAEHIQGARFVLLDGDAGAMWGSPQLTDVVEEFLTGMTRRADSERILATVLFSDVAASTNRAVQIGDRRWRQILDRHDDLARTSVDAFGGRLIKTTGDGILATFDGPARAIRCALSLANRVETLGIDVRTGIHCGEIELRGSDVGGIGVHIASRVLSHASPGEVLVSRTVKDLVMGSDVSFQERGSHVLKGIPGNWELFAVARS